MTIWVRPSVDTDVIELMPEIVDICRSIGAATATAMFSALAPGKVAVTEMVGKSTAGSAATGEQPIGECSEDDERRRHQRGEHRTADAKFGQTHVRTPPSALARGDSRPVR